MSKRNTTVITALGVLIAVLVALAVAQQAPTTPSCPVGGGAAACCPAEAAGASASGCPVKQTAMGVVANLPFYLDGPGAILAQADKLALTADQKSRLQAILAEARSQALAVLTDVQVAALGTLPQGPVTMAQVAAPATAADSPAACEDGCTKPCCAETGVCPLTGEVKEGPCSLEDAQSCCPGEVPTAAAEQTSCPIMAGPINKALFVEYEGKKVYFCCAGCVDKFKANPAQYVAKLPQFGN